MNTKNNMGGKNRDFLKIFLLTLMKTSYCSKITNEKGEDEKVSIFLSFSIFIFFPQQWHCNILAVKEKTFSNCKLKELNKTL